jgi:hypothetical protein
MKTVFFGFIAVAFLITFGSCSKELSVENNIDTTGTIIVPDTTYQPLEAGSSWVYQDSATGVTTTLSATDSDTIVNGQSYTVFHALSGGQTADQYFSISSHDYFSFGVFGYGLPSVVSLYLNDTASAGYNWQVSAGTFNGYPAQIQGQIIDTGLIVTIGSNTFPNVIHSQVNMQYNVGSGFQTPYATYDYYVAKGVGIIKIQLSIPSVPLQATLNLVSYSIQ